MENNKKTHSHRKTTQSEVCVEILYLHIVTKFCASITIPHRVQIIQTLTLRTHLVQQTDPEHHANTTIPNHVQIMTSRG